MNKYADKTKESKSQSVANAVSQKHNNSTFQFIDNRPEAVTQRKLQEMANNSPQAKQAAQLQVMADNYSDQQQQPIQKKENNTGLPDNLKSGIENLSGYSMDDVKVHYNSDKPAQLQAHAYAQGTDIHLGPEQEKHLPHEAWHVVQQKQGRVKPTMQMKGKVNVNDDAGLEKEANVMGAKASQRTFQLKTNTSQFLNQAPLSQSNSPVQGYFESSYLGGISGTYRHADDLSVVVDSNHGLYAENGKVNAANQILQQVNSTIELKQTNTTKNFWEGNRLWKQRQATLYKIEAKNTKNNTEGDDMELYADCGRSCGEVMGNHNRHAVSNNTNGGGSIKSSGLGMVRSNVGMAFAGGNPAGMKIEIIQNYMSNRYHDVNTSQYEKNAISQVYQNAQPVHQQMDTYVQNYNNPLNPINDLNGYWPLIEQLSEIYLSWYNGKHGLTKEAIDQSLGINKYASPSVGQGFTMSTGGNGPSTWPFHWAGVIMTSNDNADKVVLENYSVNVWDKENTQWEFQMYGTQKKGQTFHEQHLASGTHKDLPTTMVVEGD